MLRIRELRLENNLTQKELAEKISSTSKNIWAYENQISKHIGNYNTQFYQSQAFFAHNAEKLFPLSNLIL